MIALNILIPKYITAGNPIFAETAAGSFLKLPNQTTIYLITLRYFFYENFLSI